MIYKYITIALLLTANCFAAQATTNDSTENNFLKMPETIAMPVSIPSAYSQGGGRRFTGYSAVELGYGGSSSSANGIKGKGGGFEYKLELGLKFLMPTRFANRYNFFSVGLSYSQFSTKESYTDTGLTTKTNYKFSFVGLPLSYMSVDNEHNVGFYYQVGANINYILKPQVDDNAPITKFGSIGIEPSVSLGMSILYEHKDRRYAALLGLFAADAVTNLASETGATMHFYTIGFRYTSVSM